MISRVRPTDKYVVSLLYGPFKLPLYDAFAHGYLFWLFFFGNGNLFHELDHIYKP